MRFEEYATGIIASEREKNEDLNDHDFLRHDPLLALLSGKLEGRAC